MYSLVAKFHGLPCWGTPVTDDGEKSSNKSDCNIYMFLRLNCNWEDYTCLTRTAHIRILTPHMKYPLARYILLIASCLDLQAKSDREWKDTVFVWGARDACQTSWSMFYGNFQNFNLKKLNQIKRMFDSLMTLRLEDPCNHLAMHHLWDEPPERFPRSSYYGETLTFSQDPSKQTAMWNQYLDSEKVEDLET